MEQRAEPAWAAILEQSGLAQAIRESVWIYPALNVAHVLAAALLVGSIAVFDLRILGAGRAVPAAPLARFVLPLSIASLAAMLVSGAFLFATEATALIQNPVFLTKLALIAAALLNVAVFHRMGFRSIEAWEAQPPAPARIAAGISLLLWIAILMAGRLIAYF